MTAAITTLLLFQMQMPMPTNQSSAAEERRILLEMYTRQVQQEKANGKTFRQQQAERQAMLQDYFFSLKFNKFVTSLRNFIAHYNDGKVDMKEVKAVQKAWRDLERTEGWFRTQSTNANASHAPAEVSAAPVAEQAACAAGSTSLAIPGGQ